MCECGQDHQVLLELTYNQLLRQTKSGETIKNSPRERNSNQVQVQEVNLIPSVQNKTLTARARTRTADKHYDTIIQFSGVSYFNEGGHGRQPFQGADGTEYFIDPIRPYKSKVKVRCGCLDFYFRFSVWDHRDDVLSGDAPESYQRKTDTYPPVNPQKVSGLCKHIMGLTRFLKSERLIR